MPNKFTNVLDAILYHSWSVMSEGRRREDGKERKMKDLVDLNFALMRWYIANYMYIAGGG